MALNGLQQVLKFFCWVRMLNCTVLCTVLMKPLFKIVTFPNLGFFSENKKTENNKISIL